MKVTGWTLEDKMRWRFLGMDYPMWLEIAGFVYLVGAIFFLVSVI